MKYAVIRTGGKQYMVREGDILLIEKVDTPPGEEISFEVLALSDDGDLSPGKPVVENAKVVAEVQEHLKGPKVIIFKKRRRKDSKVKRGHRQWYTKIVIKRIETGG